MCSSLVSEGISSDLSRFLRSSEFSLYVEFTMQIEIMERKEFGNIESMSNNILHSSRESSSNVNLAMSVLVGSFIVFSGVELEDGG